MPEATGVRISLTARIEEKSVMLGSACQDRTSKQGREVNTRLHDLAFRPHTSETPVGLRNADCVGVGVTTFPIRFCSSVGRAVL